MKRMNYGSDPAPMITPQEICDIMEKAGTTDDIRRAVTIVDEYRKRHGVPRPQNMNYDIMCLMSYIYQAGRIQGIREQRAAGKAREA